MADEPLDIEDLTLDELDKIDDIEDDDPLDENPGGELSDEVDPLPEGVLS